MTAERRTAEIRLAGRTLTGIAMPYETRAQDRAELFRAGAFAPLPDNIALNLQHDAVREIASLRNGLVLQDTPAALELRAELREDSAELNLVRRGVLNGLSVEFHALEESRQNGIRVIEKAQLAGIGLVDVPSYPGSRIELRQRARLMTLRGGIPAGQVLDCRCSPGDCTEALFERGAMDGVTAPGRERDVLAVVGDYSAALASQKRRSVRFWSDGNGGLQYAIDIPNSERGRALIETMDSVNVYGRPVIDLTESEFTRNGTLARYGRAEVRALTLGATDADRGWTPLREKAGDADDLPAANRAAEPQRRQRWH